MTSCLCFHAVCECFIECRQEKNHQTAVQLPLVSAAHIWCFTLTLRGLGGWQLSVPHIYPHHLLSPLIHLFFPLSQCPNWLLLAWLSRLAAFTETAPKRMLGCGRMRRCVRTYLCLCDFGWHKSSQHCPLVKESNYFGTFQPCPILYDVYLFLLFYTICWKYMCLYIRHILLHELK